MSAKWMNRRLLLTSFCAIALAMPALGQHTDGTDTTHGSGKGRGAGGSGGQRGKPEDPHSGEDDHGDDHGGDDDHGDADDHGDDHGDGDDHASGGKGKGPKYKGGSNADSFTAGHGRSLEDKVLKVPDF